MRVSDFKNLLCKAWSTELQRVVHAPDQNGCWKRGTPSKLRIQFPRAFARQGCPAVYSPVADDDSPRVPEGCRFKRCKEIIKVKEPSAKIGLAFFHLSAPSAYAKNMMPVGKNKRCGLRVFSGYTSAVPCCAVSLSISPAVPVTGPFGGMGHLELVGALDEESMGP